MGKRKTTVDYHALAENRGFEWVGATLPKNTLYRTRWRCAKGHEWNATYSYMGGKNQGISEKQRVFPDCPYCSGTSRKNEADYLALAQLHGVEWIGATLPKTISTRTRWRCAKRHEWDTTYASIQHGTGCPYCSDRPRKTIVDYHTLVENRDLEWIGETLPKTISTRTRWRCAKGHEWNTTYASIQHGTGCPYCSDRPRKTKVDYHALVENRDLEWIGETLPKNTNIRTRWQCANGHKWDTTYVSIQRGTGCPYCSGRDRKTAVDYHRLAQSRGFEWVGATLPKNTLDRTRWRCSRGHMWDTSYNYIRVGGKNQNVSEKQQVFPGCPYCSGTSRKTEVDYHALAEKRGFEWLGTEKSHNDFSGLPKNTSTRTRWQCAKGHKWNTTYVSIQRGTGCPYCSGKDHKTAADYHALAKKRGFQWIGKTPPKNTGTRTRWKDAKGHKWYTTYAAIQRGTGCPHCSGRARKTAADYHALAEKQGFMWIGETLPTRARLTSRWKCKNGHEWNTSYSCIQQGSGCPYCSGIARKTAADYHALAEKRGFEWLGTEKSQGNFSSLPKNTSTHTRWRCENNHEWNAYYSSIRTGSGCPHCSGTARKTAADYHALAEKRGFAWIGETLPKNTVTRTYWRCGNNHEWAAYYNSIRIGSGCPYCSSNARKTAADYHALAKKQGFAWIGESLPKNTVTRTHWRCGNNHEWAATYAYIRGGANCPHRDYRMRRGRAKRKKTKSAQKR